MSKIEYSDRDCTVYIGNIEKRVTEEIIFELFVQVNVAECTNDWKKSRIIWGNRLGKESIFKVGLQY